MPLYFVDNVANRIDGFDMNAATGTLANRRPFVEGGPDAPDGSGIHAEGCLWNARWGADCLIHYRPEGTADRSLPSQPSS